MRGPVDAVSERGSLYASFVADPAGRLETSRGSVEVLLPVRARAQLEAVSRRGGVEIDPDFSPPPSTVAAMATTSAAHVSGRAMWAWMR